MGLMFYNCNLIQNSLSKIVLKNFCMIFVIISIKLYLLNLISNLFIMHYNFFFK